MSDELRAKAVELKAHAWLSRFRRADYENRFNELSPFAANEIAQHVDRFLDACLAEHDAARAEVAKLRGMLAGAFDRIAAAHDVLAHLAQSGRVSPLDRARVAKVIAEMGVKP